MKRLRATQHSRRPLKSHTSTELSQVDANNRKPTGALLMTYMIDAQLEHGVPSLKLIDAATGEERLHWQGDSMGNSERDWKNLFKRLVLLSCADQISLVQRAKLPTFGGECAKCTTCVSEEKDRLLSTGVVPLRNGN